MVIGSMVIGSRGEMIHLKIGLRIGVNNIDPQLQRDILEIVGPKILTLIKNLPETTNMSKYIDSPIFPRKQRLASFFK